MSFANHFVRALVPVALVATPAAAPAATSADLAKVQAHLNTVSSMTADFVQTDGKGRSLRGTLQLKRPGRIRFEYAKGANMLLVADGSKLTFIDYDVGQKNHWDVNKTPLGLLLTAKPNVKQDGGDRPRQGPARSGRPRARPAAPPLRVADPGLHPFELGARRAAALRLDRGRPAAEADDGQAVQRALQRRRAGKRVPLHRAQEAPVKKRST